jgi:hypothetical protein
MRFIEQKEVLLLGRRRSPFIEAEEKANTQVMSE